MSNITRYNPFNEALSLREAMDRLFEDSFISPRFTGGRRGANANLYETNDGFTLQLPVPGVRPEDVDITVRQDTVSLKWEVKTQAPENATVHWNGLQGGQFQESFMLPAPINSERVEAHYNNGILTLHLPKAEQAKTRSVKITPQ